MRLATRMQEVAPSAILALTADCRRRQAAGRDVVDLGLGEPDRATPPHVLDAAARAARDGHTRYTPPAGVAPLRSAIVRHLSREGLAYAPREVMVTCGAMGALACAFHALVGAGDEVLLPAPYYPPYLPQIGLVGGRAVVVPTEESDGFRLRPEALRAALTPRSRLLVLNSPSNPAGTTYGRGELAALAEVAAEGGLLVVADEVYRDLTEETAFTSLASLSGEIRARMLLVRSVSKSYAMTGWRIGYAAGPEALVDAMVRVQEALLVMPSSVSQQAALAALTGPQDGLLELAASLRARARYARSRLAAMPGIRCAPADGTFFAFPALGSPGDDVADLCAWLLDRHGVSVVPGSAFGVPWCARLSCAAPEDRLREGLDRLERGLAEARERDGRAL